jgi:leader peptidase (prepilin peptidase) / N-methyltransferase
MNAGAAIRLVRDPRTRWAAPVAVALAVITFVYLGPSADAAVWALVQVVLVALTAIDAATRRLPNVITIPTAAVAVVLRLLFERHHLVEVLIAGSVSFVVCYVVALALRGGLGMGDVKLAGMLGFVLGYAVVPALVLGVFAGGVWSLGLIVSRKATLRSSIAYGPFLALGGMAAILFSSPPPLV